MFGLGTILLVIAFIIPIISSKAYWDDKGNFLRYKFLLIFGGSCLIAITAVSILMRTV